MRLPRDVANARRHEQPTTRRQDWARQRLSRKPSRRERETRGCRDARSSAGCGGQQARMVADYGSALLFSCRGVSCVVPARPRPMVPPIDLYWSRRTLRFLLRRRLAESFLVLARIVAECELRAGNDEGAMRRCPLDRWVRLRKWWARRRARAKADKAAARLRPAAAAGAPWKTASPRRRWTAPAAAAGREFHRAPAPVREVVLPKPIPSRLAGSA